jgi:hypothetical protein
MATPSNSQTSTFSLPASVMKAANSTGETPTRVPSCYVYLSMDVCVYLFEIDDFYDHCL